MGKVYALLVGINEYRSPVRADLRGCLNDVAGARAALEAAAPGRVLARVLTDGGATAAAVEEGIRGHLGRAGAGDTALLWFSGHGTEYPASTPQELLLEPTGLCQALVCADGPLPDKRLGGLLDGAAAGGARVVAVLDCCFSGGASRKDGAAARALPPLPQWRPSVAAARDLSGPVGRPRHVLLAASRLGQPSYERLLEGPDGPRTQGVFSYVLTRALRRAAPSATARELLAEADAGVRRLVDGQQPVLFPAEPGGPADRPLLGGAARRPSPYLLREGPDGWEVDCGRVHGLTGGAGTEFTAAGGLVRATAVRADRTLVDPDGWAPEPGSVHAVSLSALALPPAAVVLDGEGPGGEGPGGGPVLPASPLLREVAAGSAEAAAAGLLLRVEVRGARARILRRDGSPYVPPLPLATAADTARLADCLTRLVHWHRIRDLSAGLSPLSGHVKVEVLPWAARDGEPLRPDANGEIVLSYDGPREPWVTVRLRNTGPRPLWCVLVNLDDRFGAGSELFPGQFIGPGMTGHALDGQPVRLVLPASRPVRPGASVRDWLTVVAAEGELNTVPFHLSRWEPDAVRADAPRRAPVDGLLRLAGAAGGDGGRDLLPALPSAPGQWAASTLALRTVVP
ncbi:caspase family protein [Streptomyces sp. NBC_00091]|uniref:caspase family protein n=1 Tax=Streptomyces sp. NBC_00091 TaxID=2975648 RepID=UPI0022536F7B|nr:caspase family protein [Streptomyces sp. NBC_00091]MCX5380691.1 caspase family protein [Streptomyces sp. NBC_00091]